MIYFRLLTLFSILFITFFTPSLFALDHVTSKTRSSPTILSWKMLAEMDSKTGTMPASLTDIKDIEVQVSGFIVPIEMGHSIDKVSVFALVPDPLSCIHVPPPPPNQMIYVTMDMH